jgi:hypothetical protein
VAAIPLPCRYSQLPPATDWQSRATQRATLHCHTHLTVTPDRNNQTEHYDETGQEGGNQYANESHDDDQMNLHIDNENHHNQSIENHHVYEKKTAPQPQWPSLDTGDLHELK